jgi:alpha-mannosidase
MDVRLTAPDGSAVPVQVLSSERYANGALLTADIAFVARDVPAVGYAVYRLEPVTSPSEPATAVSDQPVLENEFYRLTCDPQSGTLTSLRWKSDGWEALRGPANVVAREEDHGDLWEPYKPLDGGSRIAMTTEHGVPASDKATFSNEPGGAAGTFTHGAVVSEFRVERPFGQSGTFVTVVRVYAGLPRIDIHTEILNEEQFVRYRALFPTTISTAASVHEIPFGAVTRAAGIEFPAQNWMDYGDGQHGLALLNRGLPGNNVSRGTMMLSLLRSTRIVAYGFGGGYEPGMTSDSGFELGKKLNLDYALVPHAGSWSDAAIQRRGLEFNQPLMCCTVGSHPGRLPNTMGFVDVSPENVVLSALKSGPRGSAIVRVYESAGSAVRARVRLAMPVASAQEVNLMEDDGPSLDVVDNAMQLELRPFEIKTIKLELRSLAEGAR